MDLNLHKKTALVCGSTQGLGWATAQELALLGANVILLARNEKSLQEKLSQLVKTNDQHHSYLVADFTYPEQVQQAVRTALAEYSTIHILINNTGGPAGGTILEARPESFLQGFNSHLICNQLLVQLLVPGMKEAGYGRIVNVISTSVKAPLADLGVSNTIRGAVASWSKTLATELGPWAITVNNVLPGYTNTSRLTSLAESRAQKEGKTAEEVKQEMAQGVPLRRIGKPEEFGAAAAFLCTPAAAYINGINLPVDGGRLDCL
ncbi:SDR family oxidoreductase [Siphonobacter sp.]|uniref:SDR family oxidoreductase n=1 Tax=Siphonobacter sp. TaxID=1869184 RepID=UPI003B3BC54D